ncbi:hypothetical protein GCM10010274_23110 [Streptomyces lavendofoliae]|uniref:Uncharacterized protein n=1 Tax=Streptomyces lavendofoliae TaxID=67314 RepID=A0A918HVU5_9ACTN|nr:hypothetical protein GCM10010274_23110 [Streptomyces lavendofoliae]
MIMPGFVPAFLFQFTAIRNNFSLPLVMLPDQRPFPLSLGLYAWNGNAHAEPGFHPLVVTGSPLAVVPPGRRLRLAPAPLEGRPDRRQRQSEAVR